MDHVPDAAENGWRVLVDSGLPGGGGQLSLLDLSYMTTTNTFAFGCWLVVNQPITAKGVNVLLIIRFCAVHRYLSRSEN